MAAAESVSPRKALGSGLLKQTPAWAVSMLVHIIVLLSMALVVNDPPKKEEPRMITASAAEVEETFEEFEEEMPQEDPGPEQEITDAVVMPDSTNVETVQVVSAADELDAAEDRLRMFLEQYWGGPRTYSDQRGHPRLRMRHAPFRIGPIERDAWLRCMHSAVASIDAQTLDDEHRAQLLGYLDMAAQHMVNASF